MKLSRLVSLTVVFILCCSEGSAQLAREWVARFSSAVKKGSSGATAMTTDDSGYVYVTGWTTRATTGVDFVTIKYSQDGERLWTAYYDGGAGGKDDKAVAIAVDSSADVYVTGSSDGGSGTGLDYATVKYNRTGDTVRWVRRYDGPGHGADIPVAVAVDDSFHVYVTGSSMGSGTGLDFATVKYNPGGDTAWIQRHDGPKSGSDFPAAMILKQYADLYVTGSQVDTMYDYFTIKYNAITGDSVWAVEYNGTGNANDFASAMALQGSGLYVTGSSQDSTTGYDYATVRYSTSTGVPAWVSRYDGPANADDYALAVSVYSSSRVYVTGRSLNSGSFNDVATVAYGEGTGNEQWASSFNGSANDDDVGIAVTGEKDPVVLATVVNSGVGKDYALLKYKGTSGSLQWDIPYNGPGNDDDVAADIAAQGGSYLVTGTSIGGGFTNDLLTIKYADPNHLKYRTFIQDSLTGKSANIKIGARPVIGNVRDTAFARAFPKIKRGYPGFPGGMVIGNARPDSARKYSWIRFDKGTAVAASLPATGKARPLDSIGGLPWVGERRNLSLKKYNNHLEGQLTTLLINIGASDAEVTPPTLGDLTYNDGDTSNHYNGNTLRQLTALVNNYLTYYRSYKGVNYALFDSMLSRVNRSFQGPLKIVSSRPLVVTGAVLIDSVSFLSPSIAPLLNPLAFPPGSLEETPKQYSLYQNYPNPFNPTTTLRFDLPLQSFVTMKVYNILGQEVATLLDHQQMDEGMQEVQFNAANYASGVYFYRIMADGLNDDGMRTTSFVTVKKMLLLK